MSKQTYFEEMNKELEPQTDIPKWYYTALLFTKDPRHEEAKKLAPKFGGNPFNQGLSQEAERALASCERSRELSDNPFRD